MTVVRATQDNGQEAWKASCNKPTAEGKACDYVAWSNESESAAETMLVTHQQLRPYEPEVGLRPAREITQHYPHFISFDLPNAGQETAEHEPESATAAGSGEGEDDGQHSQP